MTYPHEMEKNLENVLMGVPRFLWQAGAWEHGAVGLFFERIQKLPETHVMKK